MYCSTSHPLSSFISQILFNFTSIESVMPPKHLILCRPFAFNLSQHQSLFQWVFFLHQVAKSKKVPIRSFSFSISLSNEYSELISFRSDFFDLLSVQGTLKNLLQHHNSKVLIPQCSAYFMGQLSHQYMATGKTMSLLFNTLSRFVITFLPRSKCLLTSWLQSPSAVILEPKKIKSVTASTFPFYLLGELNWMP